MKKSYPEIQIPLVLRFHRLMDAFAKSDDERDFYIDTVEGFLVFADLDKEKEELQELFKELIDNKERYRLIPKMTFFEIKKFMEGFVQEKVYDIDTKEKLLDIISAKDPRENFLEFIYDNLSELEKWQLYYQERSRIRIIEWLRSQNIQFVFEEDLEISTSFIEKMKKSCFDKTVSKDLAPVRKLLWAKAKSYYSSEALNPRPKRGRPPKQIAKTPLEPQVTADIYTTVPKEVRHFLFTPNLTGAESVTFSSKFESEQALLSSLRGTNRVKIDEKLEALSEKLESLQNLSEKLAGTEEAFGVKEKKSFFSFLRPKIKKPIVAEAEVDKESKVGSLMQEILPQEAKPAKKHFGIKKVTQIKSKKKEE
jgi:hypothetical protein